jgi:hypothetical protein
VALAQSETGGINPVYDSVKSDKKFFGKNSAVSPKELMLHWRYVILTLIEKMIKFPKTHCCHSAVGDSANMAAAMSVSVLTKMRQL